MLHLIVSLLALETATESDERTKSAWVNFDNAVVKLNQLTKIGTFRKIDPITRVLVSGEKFVGISAQEVQSVLPEAVVMRDDGYLAVKYTHLVVLMIRAIQELAREINFLYDRIFSEYM